MANTTMSRLDETIGQALDNQNLVTLTRSYHDQGEFLAVDHFFPTELIEKFMEEVRQVQPLLNRNYIPGHKKGGSASYYLLKQYAPSILALYKHPELLAWLSRVAGERLLLCPEDDPHACALYFYTQEGDHIGWHYDTSYYKGARYTLLVGLFDRSSSRLVCRLHTRESAKSPQDLSLTTDPGLLVFFNGDKLYHAVTPLGAQEERIVLTMQYVTNPEMGPLKRWFSNMKDAVGYFGWSALLRRPARGEAPGA